MERAHGTQERIWRLSRLTWAAMAVTLLLGMAGLFGDGPLAATEARASDGSVRVAHDRFQRADASFAFRIRIERPGSARTARLCLDGRFARRWRVLRVEPEPVAQEAAADGICLLVRYADDAPAPVTLWAQPRGAGFPLEGAMRRGDGPPARIRAVVWP